MTAQNIAELQQQYQSRVSNKKKDADAGSTASSQSDTRASEASTTITPDRVQQQLRPRTVTQTPHTTKASKWDPTKDRCSECDDWECNQTDKVMLQCDKCDLFWHQKCLRAHRIDRARDWFCHKCWIVGMLIEIYNPSKREWHKAKVIDISETYQCGILYDNGHNMVASLHDLRWRPQIKLPEAFVANTRIPEILDAQDAHDRLDGRGPQAQSYAPAPIQKLTETIMPVDCPSTYKKMLRLPESEQEKWEKSMDKEWQSILDNHVLKFVDRKSLPKGAVVIPSKWIYKIKSCGRYKSRLVCLGNLMPTEADDCSSPTPRLASARLLLSLAAKADHAVHLVDVNTAFLAAQSPVEVYIELPPGRMQQGKVGLCLRSLYGTSTAPRAFNTLLHNKMIEWGFKACPYEACLYTKQHNGAPIRVLAHVDDLAIASTEENVAWFKNIMRTTFTIDDQGAISRYLGIDVTRDENGFVLSQARLIKELAKAAGPRVMHNFSRKLCPIRSTKLLKHAITEDQRRYEKKPYRNLLGVVGYAVSGTRPDCAYAFKTLSQFNDCHTEEHWDALMELIAYMYQTADTHVMRITKSGGDTLEAYCDADWNSTEKCKSTTAWILFHGNNPISWCSKTQASTARSTAEAEFISLAALAQECIHVRMLLQSLIRDNVSAVPVHIRSKKSQTCDHSTPDCKCHAVNIWSDSANAIAQAKKPWIADKLRHIRFNWFFFKDYVRRGDLTLQHVCGTDNPADLLSKGFGTGKVGTDNQKHQYFHDLAHFLLGRRRF